MQSTLTLLAAYSMIKLDASTVSIHRLVQAVARLKDPRGPSQPQEIAIARDTATRLLYRAWPHDNDIPDTWPTCRALLPHIGALAKNSPPDADTKIIAQLLDQAGLFLSDQGAPHKAIEYHLRAIESNNRLPESTAIQKLTALNNYAYAMRGTGAAQAAAQLLSPLPLKCAEVLGASHPVTLSVCNNLGEALVSEGRMDLAIPFLERVAAAHDQGTPHGAYDLADTLSVRGTLAGAYLENGNFAKAIELFKRALVDSIGGLGHGHP